MEAPPQGFRHAATLLLTSAVRTIPPDASPTTVEDALVRLARDLASLADDMRASPATATWLTDEYARTLSRLPHTFDIATTRERAAVALARAGAGASAGERKDLFLIYVPEDRLPVAAPLAVELTKRRVSVAFSEYEVATAEQLAEAIAHGLARHGAGVVLATSAFARTGLPVPQSVPDRLRLLRDPHAQSTTEDLAAWARLGRVNR